MTGQRIKLGNLSAWLVKKNIRSMRMYLNERGEVIVSVPLRVSYAEAQTFARQNREWAEKKTQIFWKKVGEVCPDFGQPDSVVVQGRRISLVYETSTKASYSFREGTLFLYTKQPAKEERRKIFVQFFEEAAVRVLTRRYQHVARTLFPDFQVIPKLLVKRMKKSYGRAYMGKNQIALTDALLIPPEELCDYVIAHELTHFLHPNHQRGFYEELSRRMPDHRHREALLKKRYLPYYPI